MKKFCRLLFLCALAFSLASESLAAALPAGPSPDDPTAPDILASSIANPGLLDVEIYNQADAPTDVTGWHLQLELVNGCAVESDITVDFPDGWMLPASYLNFAQKSSTPAAPDDFSVFFAAPDADAGCAAGGAYLSEIKIVQGQNAEQTVTIPSAASLPAGNIVQHRQRGNAASTTRTVTGDFGYDYSKKVALDTPLTSDPLYAPPATDAGLQILEILPHSRNCSPDNNTSPDCADYVKLFNPTNAAIDLSEYRLRIGYKGQSVGVANTFHFGQMLAPGKYFTLAARDDGQALSITDSGNFVWLEDAYGVKTYGSAVQYPSASSAGKVGWAWAWDGAAWRWTSAPHPFDANYFPPELPVGTPPGSVSTLKPCAANQYRSPETNRCRLIVSASTLVPCRADQTRNPETNRCRSALASSSSLQPCKAGQVRNPETNRCKSAITTASSLKPCQPGWERNPDTNRCRKGAVLGSATTKVQDVRAPTATDHTRWLLAGIAVVGALAYAAYEWRQELTLKFAGVTAFTSKLTKSKK